MPPRDLEQPGPPVARPPEALAKPAHVAPGGLELLLAHHFPCAGAGQDQAALHGGPKHVLRLLREVLVDVLPARNRRDRGRGDRRVPPGALVRRAERGVRSPQNLGLGVRFLGRSAPGARGKVLGVAQPVVQGPAASCGTSSTQSCTTLQRQLTLTSTMEDLLRPDTSLVYTESKALNDDSGRVIRSSQTALKRSASLLS